ncbi:MAG: hypothetical protein P8077_01340, partial [Gammaproteobacteria bacterium]
ATVYVTVNDFASHVMSHASDFISIRMTVKLHARINSNTNRVQNTLAHNTILTHKRHTQTCLIPTAPETRCNITYTVRPNHWKSSALTPGSSRSINRSTNYPCPVSHP